MLVFPLKVIFFLLVAGSLFCYSDLWWGNVPKWKPINKPSLQSEWDWS